MTQATISEVKHNLDRYLTMVRKGAVVRIVDGRVAVAEIVPIARPAGDRRGDIQRLEEMERTGLIRRGTSRMDRELLDGDPPGQPMGVLDALLEERNAR
jgi:antitoxin (DNA-binding transcriptional repressor) of toxin-antitoxin stability system